MKLSAAARAAPCSVMTTGVLRMILSQSGKLVLFGFICGLALTLVLGRLRSNLLFGVSAFNPVVLALVCGLLLIVAAARIAPLHALGPD